MLLMLAMAGMMGMGGMPTYSEPKRYSPPRKLTPEEEAVELENRKAKFLADLEKHNEQRKKDFPKWKEYEVYGLKIIASKQHNALRDMKRLMRYNYLAIPE
jgi:hypothetical protein